VHDVNVATKNMFCIILILIIIIFGVLRHCSKFWCLMLDKCSLEAQNMRQAPNSDKEFLSLSLTKGAVQYQIEKIIFSCSLLCQTYPYSKIVNKQLKHFETSSSSPQQQIKFNGKFLEKNFLPDSFNFDKCQKTNKREKGFNSQFHLIF